MKILVVGGTGATGKLLLEQLLHRGHHVRAIVRSATSLPEGIQNHANLSLVEATLLELSDAELSEQVAGCEAVASCLGHNLSFQGVFGQPRRLVTDATRRLCSAIQANKPETSVKYVLMNTAGNSNRDLKEPISWAQKGIIGLLRLLLPPHVDNEQAADFLRLQIGQDNPHVDWVAVRPDSLVNQEAVSDYDLHVSPIRSAIFDPGKTSRINVAHFMADLITSEEIWNQWKGQMPVIYNQEVDEPQL